MTTKLRRPRVDPTETERLGVGLPLELAEAVRVEAARRRRTISQIVAERLTDSYRRERTKSAQSDQA